MICGQSDRYYFDKSWWRRWCPKESGHKGSHFDLVRPPVIEVDVEEEDVEAFIVTAPGYEVAMDKLPTSPRKYFKWVVQNKGWEVRAAVSETWHEPVLYRTSGKLGRKGDVKTSARRKIHTQVAGVMRNADTTIAHFRAYWETVDGKTLFKIALTWDMFTLSTYPEKKTGPFDEWLGDLAPLGAPKPKEAPVPKITEPIDAGLALLTQDWSYTE